MTWTDQDLSIIEAYERGERITDIMRTHHVGVRRLMRLVMDAGITPRRYARLTAKTKWQILAGAERRPPRTAYQLAVLDAIRDTQPGVTLTDIANRAHVSRSMVSRLVRRWQQAGEEEAM